MPGVWRRLPWRVDVGSKMTDTDMMFVFAGMILDEQEARKSARCVCCDKPVNHRPRRYKTRRRRHR